MSAAEMLTLAIKKNDINAVKFLIENGIVPTKEDVKEASNFRDILELVLVAKLL